MSSSPPIGSSPDTSVSVGASPRAVARATVTATVPLIAYASVVDNRTGDPIMVEPIEPDNTLMIAAAAHVGGLAGTDWRTDLEIANFKPQTVECTIDLLKTGFDNSTPKFAIVSVPANSNVRVRDVVDAMLDQGLV